LKAPAQAAIGSLCGFCLPIAGTVRDACEVAMKAADYKANRSDFAAAAGEKPMAIRPKRAHGDSMHNSTVGREPLAAPIAA